ncbi:MAG: hypothetical protein WAM85_22400 [Terracidiphilus sp.]
MRSSRPISLFAERPLESQRPTAYLVSVTVHCVVVAVVIYGFVFAPRINMEAAADRYVVRDVDLYRPDPERYRPPGDSGLYPRSHSDAHSTTSQGKLVAPSSSLRQIARRALADKTLLQPDTPINKLILKTTPIPSLLLWSAKKLNVKVITPPMPQKPVTAQVPPSLERPNMEVNLAVVAISSTSFVSVKPMPVPASTSPVVVNGPEPEHVPETSSTTTIQPSSAAVMALSDLSMAQGRVVLPPANQTAPGNPTGALAPGISGNSPLAGKGDPSSKGAEKNARESLEAPGSPAGAGSSQSAGNSGNAGAGNGSGGAGQGSAPSFTRINLPHDGKFGVVVVGSSMNELYPETADFWGGRLVYTVYLHVGLAKNWILQYSLPATADAAQAGSVTHLEAPWPFYIVRPNIDPVEANADALMIHGFVNTAGRFESLALVFPPGFPQAQLVLEALKQWQFRSATQNGKNARAEVLLIIPEDGE